MDTSIIQIHTLKDGSTVINTSLHGFKFSDGTECAAQNKDLVEALSLSRKTVFKRKINDMSVNEVGFIISKEQYELLEILSKKADIVILPILVIETLKRERIRDQFPNCVGINTTPETRRTSNMNDKIIDIDNWSW